MSHPRAPFVRERAPEWKAPLPSASVRDSPGSRLGLAPGTPGIRFGDVWGRAFTFISRYENVCVFGTSRKMPSSCQTALGRKVSFYEVNLLLSKDKTNLVYFPYNCFRNSPATVFEGQNEIAFRRRGVQVFFGLGKRRPILAAFSGVRILRHREIRANSWPRQAQSKAAAGPRQCQCKGAAAGLCAVSVNTFGMAWEKKHMAFQAKTCVFLVHRERCPAAARRHLDENCHFTK